MRRVESKGSVWLFDHDRYCRFPKLEAGREHPEWGNSDAGALHDAVWHEHTGWFIAKSVPDGYPVLRIERSGLPVVYAPYAVEVAQLH